jgi:hypothetical protein
MQLMGPQAKSVNEAWADIRSGKWRVLWLVARILTYGAGNHIFDACRKMFNAALRERLVPWAMRLNYELTH